jgi:hypothetical protein
MAIFSQSSDPIRAAIVLVKTVKKVGKVRLINREIPDFSDLLFYFEVD